ncbi:hypothetical protein [Litoribrevibacter albus]|uniref:Uncharacterized protein n=1 Tax=Litoribrevibacter albus TaxID=1473156 RepID=A0AA37SA91_9GAMM|nr:hypothetical protein [Litoribrevibacter albus]GLQ31366.1 hypothetical protein GCM10007876_18450 [Litoribrevibacter albus]
MKVSIMDRWCVVANIKKEIPCGDSGTETKVGLRKFKGGAKVYIVGAFYGTAESIIVIGQHRRTGKFVSCIIPVSTVENLRVKKVYKPQIIDFLQGDNPCGAHMTSTEEIARELAELIPKWSQQA